MLCFNKEKLYIFVNNFLKTVEIDTLEKYTAAGSVSVLI